MKLGSAVRGVVAMLVLGIVSAAPVQDATQDRVKELEAKLMGSEKRNFELEKENALLTREKLELANQLIKLQTQLAAEKTNVPLQLKKVPDNWVQRDFNGVTYYLVPLDGGRVDQKPVIAK